MVLSCESVLRGPRLLAGLALVFCIAPATVVLAGPQRPPDPDPTNSPNLDRQFQSAASYFDAGQYAAAERELKPLLMEIPGNSQVNELMGLIYAAEGQEREATTYLEKAVQLDPRSGAAHTNLAANLVRLGKDARAEAEFRRAVELEPDVFDPNHDLAEFYARLGQFDRAVPYFRKAQSIDPSSSENGYDLGLAEMRLSRFADARADIKAVLARQDTAELHSLLAGVEERAGDYVASAREYELAAHMKPSEDNLFAWGCELLRHAAYQPATQVFSAGSERYPLSARMELGMGIALYARGIYDKAVEAFAKATDLDPNDPRSYQFLAKVYDLAPNQADAVTERLRRFAKIAPENGQAQYDYAMSLWKARRDASQGPALDQVEPLLRRAIELNSKFPDAHLQLGILYSERHQYQKAIGEYRQAIGLDPSLAEAHYRLGQALSRLGEAPSARRELQIYQRLHERQVADSDRKRNEIRQLVLTIQGPGGSTPSALVSK